MHDRFIIDKITNSIEHAITGDQYNTEVIIIDQSDLRSILKKDGWSFNWRKESSLKTINVYKLLIEGESRIHGLMSMEEIFDERYFELRLIEAAPHNFGPHKEYMGVLGNPVAFACKTSFEKNYDGVVAFTAKTSLIEHYKKQLGATLIFGNNRMCIFTEASKKLVTSYYPNYFHDK